MEHRYDSYDVDDAKWKCFFRCQSRDLRGRFVQFQSLSSDPECFAK